MSNGQWPKVRGKALPYVHPLEMHFAPNLPLSFTQKITTLRGDALARGLVFRDAGWTGDVVQVGDSPLWQVIARVEGDPNATESDAVNTHELMGNVLSPSNLNNPVLLAQFSGANKAKEISFVDALVDEVRARKKTYDEAVLEMTTNIATIPSVDLSKALDLFDELLLGVNHYHAFSYAYRHSLNFGSVKDLATDFSNVGCIFTTPELKSAENTPSDFDLPPGEWLKIYPQKVQMLGGRKSVTYEYWFADQWSRLNYLLST